MKNLKPIKMYDSGVFKSGVILPETPAVFVKVPKKKLITAHNKVLRFNSKRDKR